MASHFRLWNYRIYYCHLYGLGFDNGDILCLQVMENSVIQSKIVNFQSKIKIVSLQQFKVRKNVLGQD